MKIINDHDAEFENQAFDKFYSENEINHNFFAPNTAQQNEIIEKKKGHCKRWYK